MNLIDTHAHLYWESYKPDLEEVLKRAKDAGVTTIVNVGVDLETSKKALDQSKNIRGLSIFSTIAIHPEEAINYSGQNVSDRKQSVNRDLTKDLAELEQIYNSNPEKVVAIGECGLDYFFQNKNYNGYKDHNYYKKLQKKLFQAQIDLAKKLNLPLVIHCREAWDETLKMLGNQPAILHCYSGLSHNTKYIIHNTNLYVSFAGNITYPKNDYLREAAKLIPLERILLETDSPFLAPQSKRGQRNEPSAVSEIAQLIANLKGISLEKVATQTTKNATSLLSLKHKY